MSNNELDNFGEPERLGEGWWASVMDDECYEKAVNRKKQLSEVNQFKPEVDLGIDVIIDWNYVQNLFDREEVVTGTIVDYNKGGLLVCGENFQGFVPVSHLDEILTLEENERFEKLENFVGRRMCLKIIECDKRRGRIVLSERAAKAEPGQRQKLLETLEIGMCISGRVTNVTDFGVFVDLGGVEGLVHISELSWGRVTDPRRHVDINQNLEVLVLQINREQCRVSLSIKQTKPNPWIDVLDRYPKGQVIQAKITDIVKFGAFARLEDGLEGLIHISEMNCDDNVSPKDLLTKGQIVNVEIVLVEVSRQRMSLRLVNHSGSS